MRIVIASQSYDRQLNGQAVFAIQLAEGMADIGHDVVVITPSEKLRSHTSTARQRLRIEYVRAISLAPVYPNVHITIPFCRKIGEIIDAFRPDVLHIQDHYPLCRSVFRAAVRRGLPIIGSNHFLPENMAPYVPVLRHWRSLVDHLLWRGVLKTFNCLDLVTAPSETGVRLLREHHLAVPVLAVSCGIDLNRFRPDSTVNRKQVRRQYGLSPDHTLFVYVGRVDREKRLEVLLEALQLLDREKVQLAIVGKGRSLNAMRRRAQNLMLGDHVVFTGYLPDEAIPPVLNSADVFVMPSEAELLSLATVEAMASGLPILAARARALPELVTDGENGYLFESDNPRDVAGKMARIVDYREDWKRMGAASREKAGYHELGAAIRRFEQLYKSLIASV